MSILISYDRTNHAFVERLVDYLQQRGVQTWVDKTHIKPGSRWRDELLRQLQTCDGCVVVLSPRYLASEVCRMEVFMARSFNRLMLPVMTEGYFADLRTYEDTKGLEDVFMMRMHRLSAAGLPITEADVLRRLAHAAMRLGDAESQASPVYVSYSDPDGAFATDVARAISSKGIPTWIATLDIAVGQNWRDAQARAMLRARAHVVVLDQHIVKEAVLRTEILLADARGLNVYTVLPPRLNGRESEIDTMLHDLDRSDHTYRRLAATQFFTVTSGVDALAEQLATTLRKVPTEPS